MVFECICGNVLSNAGSPNDTVCLLLSDRSLERLQDLVDAEVLKDGVVDGWPEHWENSGGIEAWRCLSCQRLYLFPNGPREGVVVYAVERSGMTGGG